MGDLDSLAPRIAAPRGGSHEFWTVLGFIAMRRLTLRKGAILMMLQHGVRKRARAAIEMAVARSIALGVAVMLAACATLTADSSPEAKQAAVKKRVEARWAALIKGDVSGSYALLSPASKAVLTEGQYRDRIRRSGYESMDIETIDCAGDSCRVHVWITFDATPIRRHPIKGIRTMATETWVIDRGDYWYVWPN